MSEDATNLNESGTPNEPAEPQGDGTGVPSGLDLNQKFTAANAPYPWAEGRTVREVLDIGQGMMDTLSSGNIPAQPAEPTHNQPAPAPAQPARRHAELPSDNLRYERPEEYEQKMEEYIQSKAQELFSKQAETFAAPLYMQQKQTSRALASQRPEVKEVFDRYGHEIDQKMLNVDPRICSVDAYVQVAKLIKGEHIDDFIQRELDRRVATGAGTVSGTAPGQSSEPLIPADEIDEFFDGDHPYAHRMREDGVTKVRLRESIKKMGMTPKTYIESIKRGNMISTLGGRVVTTQLTGGE